MAAVIPPTRRQALGLSLGAMARTPQPWPTIHSSTAAENGPDAVLISLCDRLVTLMAELDAAIAAQPALADEDELQPALDALYDEQGRVFGRLDVLPPVVTLRGAQALARAALTFGPRSPGGQVVTDDPAERLAITALTFLAGYT